MTALHHTFPSTIIWLLASILLFTSASTTFAQTGELKRLRALLVIDTSSNLKESVEKDKERVLSALARNIPEKRFEVTTLTGNDVTPQKILDYYKNLKTDSSETLLFYYAGHGAFDPVKGHYLMLGPRSDIQLFRSDIQKAMERLKPGLIVLITDCCSSWLPALTKQRPRDAYEPPELIRPVARSLFFQHHGLVDITAASVEKPSWGDDVEGGIFTRTFARLLTEPPESLDRNRDGLVSWQEFFPQLRERTNGTFVRWAKDQKARGEQINEASQQPHAFLIQAQPIRPQKIHAVVNMHNAKTTAIRFDYRWKGEEEWKSDSLEADGKKVYSKAWPGEGSTAPVLEVRFEDGVTSEMQASEYFGETPQFGAGGKVHRIRESP